MILATTACINSCLVALCNHSTLAGLLNLCSSLCLRHRPKGLIHYLLYANLRKPGKGQRQAALARLTCLALMQLVVA